MSGVEVDEIPPPDFSTFEPTSHRLGLHRATSDGCPADRRADRRAGGLAGGLADRAADRAAVRAADRTADRNAGQSPHDAGEETEHDRILASQSWRTIVDVGANRGQFALGAHRDVIGHLLVFAQRLVPGALDRGKMREQILAASVRSEDVLARIGGDEFAILLPSTNEAAAQSAVDRIEELLRGQVANEGRPRVSLSVGHATAEPGELVDALKLADARMYVSKAERKAAKALTVRVVAMLTALRNRAAP